MARFYVDMPLAAHSCIDLPENVVRHVQVRRLRVGDTLTLFNGDGSEYPAQLQSLEKRCAQALLLDALNISRESNLWIGLAQAISAAERMDLTLQKGVELGVNVFQPIFSQRSIVRLSAERALRRVERWQEIIISACEQCGRNVIPEVKPIISFNEWLNQPLPKADKLLLSIGGGAGLNHLPISNKIWLMAGAEGGFDEQELSAAQNSGWNALTLGTRILRTETAALAAAAALQTLFGDYCQR